MTSGTTNKLVSKKRKLEETPVSSATNTTTTTTTKKKRRSASSTSTVQLSSDVIKDLSNRNSYHDQVDDNDTNSIILTNDSKKKKKKKNSKELHNIKKKTRKVNPVPEISKRKVRKLKQLEEKKRKDSERGQLISTLEENRLDRDALQLLKSSKLIGVGTETTKNLVERAALHEKMGVALEGVRDERVDKYWKVRESWQNKWGEGVEELLYGKSTIETDNDDGDSENVAAKEDNNLAITTTEHATNNNSNKQKLKPQLKEIYSSENQTRNSAPAPVTPFMTLDFFGTSTQSSSTAATKEQKNKRKRVSFSDEIEDDNTDKSVEDDEETEDQDVDSMDTNNEEEEEGESENEEDDDGELSFNEQVCKKFSSLIDTVEKQVTSQEAKSIILAEIYNLLDFVVPDDEDDEDGDNMNEDSDEDESEYEESNRQFAIALRDTLSQSLGSLTADKFNSESVDLIGSILDDIDKSRTDEQKQIRYTKFFVPVTRKPEIEETRNNLPVVSEESHIMETLVDNDIILLCGETGSGKTTQVPQFLYEAGYGNEKSGNPGFIAVTQPRRVAALSTAKRVAEELNVEFGSIVSYQVRYDNNLSQATLIKFMTDGILLKEIQEDPLLLKYSVIVLDEAHERNVNTDILIGWLSRFIPQRNLMAKEGARTPTGVLITPLKLIIMSATLRVDDFIKNDRLFSASTSIPPVINITSRQFPVTVHFNKRTVFDDYVGACYKKVVKIHEQLPNGAILVFLTGKAEIDFLVSKLQEYAKKQRIKRQRRIAQQKSLGEDQDEFGDIDDEEYINKMGDLDDEEDVKKTKEVNQEDSKTDSLLIDEKTGTTIKNDTAEVLIDETNTGSQTTVLFKDNIQDESVLKAGLDHNKQNKRQRRREGSSLGDLELYALPLYSLLQPDEQLKVFEPPPPNSRLVVVATNVAETSLTIPNVRYVIDSGRVKDKEYDKVTGVSKFVIKWTSKASADQRAGRAGRTGPGHCYRLYSSALFDNTFKQFTDPDILTTPIDTIVLQMKSMGIKNVEKFPFPTPPDEVSLKTAVNSLVNIQALEYHHRKSGGVIAIPSITNMGRAMNDFPLNPRFAKMLIFARKQSVLKYMIAIVSGLTVNQLFMFDSHLNNFRQKVEQEKRKREQILAQRKRRKALALENEEEEENEDDEEFDEEYLESEVAEEDVLTQKELKMREACGKAKEMWKHRQSDLLSLLKAIGAYSTSSEPQKFAREWFLHSKNMKEVTSLMKQLKRIVKENYHEDEDGDVDLEDEDDLSVPPTKEEELTIRQIICAGLVDRVARLATEEEWPGLQASFTSKNRPYISIQLGEKIPVFIHPSSYLFGEHPKYIVYNEIAKSRTGKIYVKGVSEIQPTWLTEYAKPMVKLSKPLQTRYCKERDELQCSVTATFSDANNNSTANIWDLPAQNIVYSPQQFGRQVYAAFAGLIIDGRVFDDLSVFKGQMKVSRADIEQLVSSNAKQFVSKIEQLFINNTSAQDGMEMQNVSKKALITKWGQDSSFLKNEFRALVKERYAHMVDKMWPPKQ